MGSRSDLCKRCDKKKMGYLDCPHCQVAIVHRPGRCGGEATVGETRIMVRSIVYGLERHYHGDASAFLADYPHYTQAQIDAAVNYYHVNRQEIDDAQAEEERMWRDLAPAT